MLWNIVISLSLSLVSFSFQTPQLKLPSERKSETLPRELTENETQTILKERGPKQHIDATLKISKARFLSASRLAEQNQYETAVEDIHLYASLIIYADAYTHTLPDTQHKDRSTCLKKIEQAIFKQTRPMQALLHELPLNFRESVAPKFEQLKKIRLRALNDMLGNGQQMIKSSEEQQ